MTTRPRTGAMLDRNFSFSARCRTADPVALSAPLSPTYFPESLASPGMEEVVAEELRANCVPTRLSSEESNSG